MRICRSIRFKRHLSQLCPNATRPFALTAAELVGHLRALAQRVEVAEGEVRIMGSKSRLRQTLVANGRVNSVPIQGLNWRRAA